MVIMIMLTCINEEMAIKRFKCEMLAPFKILAFFHLVDCSLIFTKVTLKITKPVDSIIPYKYVAFYGFIIVWMVFIPPILKFSQQSQWFAPVILLLLQLLLIKSMLSSFFFLRAIFFHVYSWIQGIVPLGDHW